MTRRLVALDLPGGPEFVRALQRAWDAGDAVAPIDQRLPPPMRDALVKELAPTVIVGADGSEQVLAGGRPVETDDALVIATSGTTGAPRGVVLTMNAVHTAALASSQRLDVTTDDHWLACLPLAHIGGLSVVTRALITGTALTVIDGFDAETVNASDASLVSLVAAVLDRIDTERFRIILLGGGPAPAQRPANAVVTYGMTETCGGIVYDGRPLDGVELRVSDTGEIQVRSATLLRCYRTAAGDSAPQLDTGWFATGDIGTLDETGRLHVVGRAAEVINTGGEKVWPRAVEAVLATHPGVADVAVAGRDDPRWGQAVVAYVVARDPAPTLDEVRAHVKAQLPAYCAPHHLVIVAAIPRTNLGKIARHRLGLGSG